MPAGNAYPCGHLISPLFGLVFSPINETSFLKFVMLFPTFHLEYPSVLSRFCYVIIPSQGVRVCCGYAVLQNIQTGNVKDVFMSLSLPKLTWHNVRVWLQCHCPFLRCGNDDWRNLLTANTKAGFHIFVTSQAFM